MLAEIRTDRVPDDAVGIVKRKKQWERVSQDDYLLTASGARGRETLSGIYRVLQLFPYIPH
jgi:hypothetical protein